MSKKSIIQLSAEWCGPCRGLRANIEKNFLSKPEYSESDYQFIDIDKEDQKHWKDFMASLGIRSIPKVFLKQDNTLYSVGDLSLIEIFNAINNETTDLQDITQEVGKAPSGPNLRIVHKSEEE